MRPKSSLALNGLFLALISCAPKDTLNQVETFHDLQDDKETVSEDVIYGVDNRREYYEASADLQQIARSTVALVQSSDVKALATGRSELAGGQYGISNNLCSSEKYYAQNAAAFCSGALVGSDLILTAGHCVANATDCRNTKFVFGYHVTRSGEIPGAVLSADVYSCRELIHSEVRASGSDFAVIRLDRGVSGRSPLPVRRNGVVDADDNLTVMGHPSGLPLKIADGGRVRSIQTEHFVTNLDTFAGNSGSSVFNSRTGEIEGILVRGETDFVSSGSCMVAKKCTDTGCRGEDVTRIDRALGHIPSGGSNPPPGPTPRPTPGPSPTPAPPAREYAVNSNLAIPDNSVAGISSKVRASEAALGRKVRVRVDITHSYVGDLMVSVISPDGKETILQHRTGGSADNIKGVYGADLHAKGDLGVLSKISNAGDWSLKVSDRAKRDTGRLNGFAIKFE